MGSREQFNALSKDSFSALLELSKDRAVFLLDSYGKIISSNKDAEKITGYAVQELYGMSFSVLYPGTAVEKNEHLQALEFAKKNTAYTQEANCRKKDGSSFFAVMNLDALTAENGIITNFTLTLTVISPGHNFIADVLHLAELVERTTDAVFSTDISFTIISWNHAAEKLYGYTKDEVIGLPLKEVVRPKLTAEILEKIDRGIKLQGAWIGEIVHTTKDNKPLEIEESVSVTKGMDNQVDGYVWICRDITDYKNSRRELLHFARLMDNTNDAIYSATAPDRRILSWNKAAEKMFGYAEAEVLNKTTDEILQPQVTEDDPVRIGKIIHEKGYWRGEVAFKRKDGSLIPVLISVSIIRNDNGEIDQYLSICTDITEMKRNEESLRKMQEEINRLTKEELGKSLKETADYKYALDASSIVAIIDANGIIKYVNENFCKISQYNACELIGQEHHIINPSHPPGKEYTEDFWTAVTEGNIWKGEIKSKAKNGNLYWVDSTIVPFFDNKGKPYQYLEIGVDITEKKRTEEAFRHSEEMRSLILKSALDAIVGINERGFIIMWNTQAEKIFGWQQNEVTGKLLSEIIIPPQYREAHIRGLDHYSKTHEGPVLNKVIEITALNSSNKEFPIELAVVPIKQNGGEFFCAFIRDITERKTWEKELKDSEQKYKMLFDNNPLPMWMFTLPERNIIEVNNAACNLYGYTREEFLQMNLRDIRPAEDVQLFIEEIENIPRGLRNAGIWRHKKKDGTIIHVEIFRDDIIYQGEKVRLVLVNDITEKFITEQRLKDSHEELRSLASRLQDIREEERAVIAREIHDELGQQITGLKMDISWISKRIQVQDDAVQQKIKSVLGLLDETIKTIRKIASELRPSILDDLGLVDALQWYSLEFEKRYGIAVSFRTSVEEVKTGKHASIGLFRIYQESLTNVARHAAATFVDSVIAIKDNTLILTITDNGKGFDTAITGNKKTLGLLGMKERTLMMGGKYEISSMPGKGTTVHVSVPLQTT